VTATHRRPRPVGCAAIGARRAPRLLRATYSTLPQRVSIVAAATAETRRRASRISARYVCLMVVPLRRRRPRANHGRRRRSEPRGAIDDAVVEAQREGASNEYGPGPSSRGPFQQHDRVAVPPTGKLRFFCRLPAAWDQPRGGLRQRNGTGSAPVMGPPRVHQRRRR
jgi:hypothetical protein